MTWKNSISLEVANHIFEPLGIAIAFNNEEGVYVAMMGDKTIRRTVLKALCRAISETWLISIFEPGLRQ
jgi:hypothetical protein